ncbi:MAG: NAD-dependent epimerase/dehydratase family protein [Fuerstiella sp.]|nr:NAD-dependent epimerase/dehydratase family protein [Fuerstiella sp.]MCP4855480.1 NAD-dependent epimerase/dehydratase family protein [Fuerstiella sp.]
MRLLITGGAGFIGSHVADKAIARGWDVAVLDSLVSGRRENIPHQAEFFECDIRDKTAVERVFAAFKPTAVSHQAAQASVAVSVREPQMDAEVNIIGSLNIMAACVSHSVDALVFASTGGAIYGEVPPGIRAGVDFSPVPISPYACSKFSVEKYLECFRIEHGLKYTVLRYANVYGPRQDPHGEAGVVAIFCNRILAGEGILINAKRDVGDAGCIRDYVFINDVAGANIAALEGAIPDRILNVGTGQETTTQQLAEILQRETGRTVEVKPHDKRAGDIERSLLDADRLIELRGALVNIEDGLKQTAQWFQQRLNVQS